MDLQLLSTLVTYVVFGWIGYVWAKAIPMPARLVDWVLWLIAFLLAGSIGIGVRLVDVFGFTILLDDLLEALVLGILINFVLRLARPQLSQAKTKR
ncbi:MAG TPA: hypothetical protein VFY66_16475 [Anaerolineales bacterium]|nr:hypothetical protein [Anaerolineales bacterium]